jgi:hypothetical protein
MAAGTEHSVQASDIWVTGGSMRCVTPYPRASNQHFRPAAARWLMQLQAKTAAPACPYTCSGLRILHSSLLLLAAVLVGLWVLLLLPCFRRCSGCCCCCLCCCCCCCCCAHLVLQVALSSLVADGAVQRVVDLQQRRQTRDTAEQLPVRAATENHNTGVAQPRITATAIDPTRHRCIFARGVCLPQRQF